MKIFPSYIYKTILNDFLKFLIVIMPLGFMSSDIPVRSWERLSWKLPRPPKMLTVRYPCEFLEFHKSSVPTRNTTEFIPCCCCWDTTCTRVIWLYKAWVGESGVLLLILKGKDWWVRSLFRGSIGNAFSLYCLLPLLYWRSGVALWNGE